MEVSGNFLWISGLDIDFLASLYHNRVNSDSFEPIVQHPTVQSKMQNFEGFKE